MDKKSNPAQRLYEIIKSAKAFNGNVNAISGWIEVFRLSPSLLNIDITPFTRKVNEIRKRQDEIEAMRYLSQLIVLVDDVETILKTRSEEDYELFRVPLPKIVWQ